jgi:hypothetical protein
VASDDWDDPQFSLFVKAGGLWLTMAATLASNDWWSNS